ncbi:family 75 glycoside hydrolase [Pseudomassariella vexata]|uniref:Endo-chitosanase n=1 Tax=Pseudomassariella vexata TaxID=1141098 RepID=A0A1Y2DP81_9PEZI|nr:family 75 glycoside hydrolase [Pseudomassariella vexata]ORY60979.1 family 75 glycoside hydrolase [Pseudomassariella vexata]
MAWLIAFASARDIPPNVQHFYDRVRSQIECHRPLASGYSSYLSSPKTWSYCGEYHDDWHIVYISGREGLLANMDLTCAGVPGGVADTGACADGFEPETDGPTAFRDLVREEHPNLADLNPYVHPYVVFGNKGSFSGQPAFEPQDYGIVPLSLIAIVCNSQLIYGFWGDYNSDNRVGSAAVSVGTLCYGDGNFDYAHGFHDVLYIAFEGTQAKLGQLDANWTAETPREFEQSINPLGNRLINRILIDAAAKPSAMVYASIVMVVVAHVVVWLGLT